ncbi:MAG: 3-oxoacyl-ACP synthase [Flavobacteriaceae bacterium]|jgi:transcription elongation GreA/GreB family factor|nr:3-oxoacyl-ACP synthase [Flavobacteriaceae bacterium]MBT4960794.1 3-oxoacyl-ACP synthase [Flavobacteriaceae bacterium]MBT5232878.1 3-oxoacyl-ACP synthase [Flavobacteriaceae bacterium]MBT5493649.1 3-oxoacyl-ACP synthase [Flavobacteriaceae bacterium]MBT7572932.1 3-oxoacyl-ACP synthase [Flavobacteriaceae bacterium]|tara:strand:- start:1777 stop:2232 length:456 start_codon:yes stop_codon:yes gene_type:complete
MINLKDLLFNHCENHINTKLKNYLKIDQELFKSLNEETKSSAGDKHETTRAMIQIEREKNSKRIKEIENSKKQLIVIKSVQLNNLKVSPGSIIFTSNNNYFISISSEIYSSDTNKIYCVSTNTPIAKSYLGKKIGDIVTFNNIESKIEKII